MGVCITSRWYQSCKGLYWSITRRITFWPCPGIFTSRSAFCPDQQPTEDPDVQVYLAVVALFRLWLHSDPCGLLLPGSGFTSPLHQGSWFSGSGSCPRAWRYTADSEPGHPSRGQAWRRCHCSLSTWNGEELQDCLWVANSDVIILPMVKSCRGWQPRGILTGSLVILLYTPLHVQLTSRVIHA